MSDCIVNIKRKNLEVRSSFINMMKPCGKTTNHTNIKMKSILKIMCHFMRGWSNKFQKETISNNFLIKM